MENFKQSLKEVIRSHKKLISGESLTSVIASYTPSSVNCLILMMETLLAKYEDLEKTKDAATRGEPVIAYGSPTERLVTESLIREELDLTDRFAIAAMSTVLHWDHERSMQYEDAAVFSYALAQAMVLERAAIWREISERIHRARQTNESQD